MQKTFAILFLFAAAGQQLEVLAQTADYCDADLCRWAGDHVACNYDGAWHERCIDPNILELTPAMKKLLVDAHNEKRNFVAGGGDPKLAPACRMSEMLWDDEIAELASLNVRRCTMEHDECRNTVNYDFSGQNIAWISFYVKPNDTEYLLKSVQMWYDEIKDTYQEQIDAYPLEFPEVIGHFTGMVGDLNTRVGCAVATYQSSKPGVSWYEYLVTCNYANTNLIGLPIYETCDVPASGCTTGVNCRYANLCKASEPIDPNNIWRD